MTEERRGGCRSGDMGVIIGPIWFMGWLFTIGFLHLSFWRAVLALVIWPYNLGAFFGK